MRGGKRGLATEASYVALNRGRHARTGPHARRAYISLTTLLDYRSTTMHSRDAPGARRAAGGAAGCDVPRLASAAATPGRSDGLGRRIVVGTIPSRSGIVAIDAPATRSSVGRLCPSD